MLRRNWILIPSLLCSFITVATADQPDCSNCTATSAAGHFSIQPDGGGPTLESLGLTVTLTIRDALNQLIVGFPYQDIWLGDNAGGTEITLCSGGSYADANTDENGTTTISGAISGGGWTTSGLQVYAAGLPFGSAPLPITVTSPDLDGNLIVEFNDLSMVPGGFAQLYLAGGYDLRVDLNCDGAVNLADVTRFAGSYLGQASCP